jgi:hypothetical protein
MSSPTQRTLASPEDERATVEAMMMLRTADDPRRLWARKEALARGWRALDREDVTEEPHCIDVLVHGQKIGRLQRVYDGPAWTAYHCENPPGTILVTLPDRETALAGLLEQENARRVMAGPLEPGGRR